MGMRGVVPRVQEFRRIKHNYVITELTYPTFFQVLKTGETKTYFPKK